MQKIGVALMTPSIPFGSRSAAVGSRNSRIPVLVDGAEMPRLEELPESLKTLARRQKIDVFHANFDADVKKLTRALTLLDNELRQKAEMVAREERKRKRQAAKADRERQGPELTSKVISSEHGPAVRKISRTASDLCEKDRFLRLG